MTEDHDRASTPGSALLDVVAVMDRLRSPGGCPWDAEQTHASLTRYLLEETYEVLDAVDALEAGVDGAEADLAEELGDVLLQVVFHARVAAERGAFDVDDVAAGLAAKLVRRHPHVFADEQVRTGDAVQARWDELKAAEKPHRGPLDGIPNHLPALARADKLLARLDRAGLMVEAPPADVTQVEQVAQARPATSAEAFGAELFSLVARARAAGVDPEAALRSHVSRVAEQATTSDARRAAATGTDRAH